MRRLYKQAMVAAVLAMLAGCTTEAQDAAQPRVKYTKERRGAAALSGGAGYHGAYLVPNTPPAPAVGPKKKAPRAAPGKLPLPVDYPLSAEDERMWNTLTLEQQKRALLFLQDGSTIAASLSTE
ncbi:MAG: hypothetical protein KDE11_12345 [Rhodobacteraceae bacterium]|nr:hypothetical protein [Paracoccaceae bacterium]